eukprot:10835695-Lingulodinium_polyedra.AAC.1
MLPIDPARGFCELCVDGLPDFGPLRRPEHVLEVQVEGNEGLGVASEGDVLGRRTPVYQGLGSSRHLHAPLAVPAKGASQARGGTALHALRSACPKELAHANGPRRGGVLLLDEDKL